MNTFRIEDQVRLPLGKVVGLVVSGIRFRLLRASITVVIVGLAVAFLVATLTDSLLTRAAQRRLRHETAAPRLFEDWCHRLTVPLTEESLTAALAALPADGPARQEMAGWAGEAGDALRQAGEAARQERAFLAFCGALTEGQLRALAGRRRGRDIPAMLDTPEALDGFLATLVEMGKKPPAPRDDLLRFLADWRAAQPWRARALAAHARAVDAVRRLMGRRSVVELLGGLTAAERVELEAAGFRWDTRTRETVCAEARGEQASRRLAALLRNAAFKQRFMARAGMAEAKDVAVDQLYTLASGAAGAAWVIAAAREVGLPLSEELADVRATSVKQVRQFRAARLESMLAEIVPAGHWGLSRQTAWLIIVSLVVCVVGIANAMLMSVAERFREIATMKCLGATDSFIMTSFIFESGLQGFIGGTLGVIVGLLLGGGRSVFGYGALILVQPPWLPLLVAAAACVAIGVLLSMIAAVYPAWAAARLAPMEAMRVE